MALPKSILAIMAAAVITVVLFNQFGSRVPDAHSLVSQATSSLSGYTSGKSSVHKHLQPTQNDTLGFDKLYVLNLPERSDKRDFLSLAASFSNISLTFRDGVKGESIPTKALPEGHEERKMGESVIGSWRGHMNIIREIVENRIESALIMEDDMDWDIRIKDQMPSYASGVRSLLNQTDDTPTHSPYGDGWDVLWMGRCNDEWSHEDEQGRDIFAIENDMTVPLLQNMRAEDGRTMIEEVGLGDHTRIVHRVENPICTFAYALSLKGAQKILYSLSVGGLAWNFDNSLAWWCTDKERAYGQECIGATPTYFYQHKVKSSISRNSDNFEEQGFAEESYTFSIRYSVKKNIQRLVMGKKDLADLVDSYPDVPESQAAEKMPEPAPPHHDYRDKQT